MTRGWIDLEGAVNARDVGGLPTLDGGRVRAGRLLRSDNLQDLTPEDVQTLVGQYRLRRVLDLRTSVEVRREGPAPLQGRSDVAYRHLSLLPEVGDATDVAVDDVLPWLRDDARTISAGRGVDRVAEVYHGYLADRPDSIVAALQEISSTDDGAVLVHCAAGKDRTGVVVALALTVAGVGREEVAADYAATAEVIEPLVARLRASPTYAEDLAGRPVSSHTPQAESMLRFLDLVDERDGGVATWLAGAGFSAVDQAALRRHLVD